MTIPDLAALVRETSLEELPEVIGQLEAAKAAAWARLAAPASNGNGHDAQPEALDRLLNYREAATLLHCSVSYVETLVRQRKIPHVRLPAADKAGRSRDGRLVRLRASDLRTWTEEHRA